MAKIFNTLSKIQKVRQPLFQINRARYRGVRVSEVENFESNIIRLDLSRINLELDTIDEKILNDLIILVGDKRDITLETNLDDGLSSVIEGVGIKFEDLDLENDITIDSLDKISGKISRIISKIDRLEKGV